MPDTFQSLAVLAFALLPGALAIWAFERAAGRWTTETSDRVLRFAGVSAGFQALILPLTYKLYTNEVQHHYLRDGKPLPLSFWIGALAYIAVPYILGRIAGIAARDNWRWLRRFVGRQPVPRAWDYAFLHGRDGWIRLRMKSPPRWMIGAWGRLPDGRESFASPFPQAEALYLIQTVECDPETGEFVLSDGRPIIKPEALLVRWDEVQYLEFIDG